MTAVDDSQYQRVIAASSLAPKYSQAINRESAHEMLQKKMNETAERQAAAAQEQQQDEDDDFSWRRGGSSAPRRSTASRPRSSGGRPRQTMGEKVVNQVVGTAMREVGRGLGRGLLGMFKKW
jgi:uncharacterized protein